MSSKHTLKLWRPVSSEVRHLGGDGITRVKSHQWTHPLVNGLTELLGDGNFRRSLAGEVDPGKGCALELDFSLIPVLFFSLL